MPEALRCQPISLVSKCFIRLLCYYGFFIVTFNAQVIQTSKFLCNSNRNKVLVTGDLTQTAIKVHKVPCFNCLCSTTFISLQFLYLPPGKTVRTMTAPWLIAFSNVLSPRWIFTLLCSCAKSLNNSFWLHMWLVAFKSTIHYSPRTPTISARKTSLRISFFTMFVLWFAAFDLLSCLYSSHAPYKTAWYVQNFHNGDI